MDRPKRIAIVDDDPSVRKALARLLKTAGFQATTFASGEAYLDSSDFGRLDCLILDLHLPGIDGLELQSELAARESECPIIFVSAYLDEQARESALRAGAICFLPKPLDTDLLLRSIHQAVA